MEPIALAVIGGTGVYKLAQLDDVNSHVVETRYGTPSGPIRVGTLLGQRVAFLARHGEGHSLPPHKINYRANLAALQQIGATRVLALNTVGGITEQFGPRVLACPDQIIDYTWGRSSTYFEGPGSPVNHIDFTEPYSRGLRKRILDAAAAVGERITDGGVYAATQGPRLESAAEINRLERDGAHIVGMTGMPEAALAREINLEYATIAVVANYGAGRGDSEHAVPLDKIQAVLDEAMGRVRRIIEKLCE